MQTNNTFIYRLLLLLLMSLIFSSCSGRFAETESYNRKNLDDYLSQSIGNVYTKNKVFGQLMKTKFIKTQTLPNQNIAYHHILYLVTPALHLFTLCNMYYEVNPKTNKIVGYTITDRFENRDCRKNNQEIVE